MFHLNEALNILSTLAVFGALVFTGLEVREANRARAEQAALAFIESIQGGGWTHAYSHVVHIPPNLTAEEIDALGAEVIRAIEEYAIRLETIGYMVFRGIVPLETVEELWGGVIMMFWERVRPWAERDRARTNNPRQLEWVQWLAERLQARRTGTMATPAQIAHANWTSPRGGPKLKRHE